MNAKLQDVLLKAEQDIATLTAGYRGENREAINRLLNQLLVLRKTLERGVAS